MCAQRRTTTFSMMAGGAFQVDTQASPLLAWAIWHCEKQPSSPSPHDADHPSRFLAGQLHIFRPRADLARVLLAMAPLIGAALIAISRLEDYRHDVFDVTVGSILGMALAY